MDINIIHIEKFKTVSIYTKKKNVLNFEDSKKKNDFYFKLLTDLGCEKNFGLL